MYQVNSPKWVSCQKAAWRPGSRQIEAITKCTEHCKESEVRDRYTRSLHGSADAARITPLNHQVYRTY